MEDIALDRASGIPLARQVAGTLRDRILTGAWAPGTEVPSTRTLAGSLGISRTLVVEAYDQLGDEGFLVSRRGSRTRVAEGVGRNLPVPGRGRAMADEFAPPRSGVVQFRTGAPDLSLFPREAWARALADAARNLPARKWDYGDPLGLPALRRAIAAWLGRSRGMVVDPACVAVTSGATQAIQVTAGLFRSEGRRAILEDPCHTAVRDLLAGLGIPVVPVPVDPQGLRVDLLPSGENAFVYVTPAHQYPLGAVLPAPRRSALVDWASRNRNWIIEDDYDGEFRFEGTPLWPLGALGPDRVVHVGSFSKTFSPAVRLGFAILPPPLVDRWRISRRLADVQPEVTGQAAMATLLDSGKFEGHLRKLRKVYAHRRGVLLEGLAAAFGPGLEVMGTSAGLHVAVRFPGYDLRRGLPGIRSAAGYALLPGTYLSDVLLFGYAHLSEAEIRRGTGALGPGALVDIGLRPLPS